MSKDDKSAHHTCTNNLFLFVVLVITLCSAHEKRDKKRRKSADSDVILIYNILFLSLFFFSTFSFSSHLTVYLLLQLNPQSLFLSLSFPFILEKSKKGIANLASTSFPRLTIVQCAKGNENNEIQPVIRYVS